MKEEYNSEEVLKRDFHQAYSWYMGMTADLLMAMERKRKGMEKSLEGVKDSRIQSYAYQRECELLVKERMIISDRESLKECFFEGDELTEDKSKLQEMHKLVEFWKRKTGGVYPAS